MRVIMLPLPGVDSKSSHLKPYFSKVSAKYFAASVSFPGGLVVFMRIKSHRRFVTSLSTSLNN